MRRFSFPVVLALACTFGVAMGQTTNKESEDFTEKGKAAYYSKDFNTAVIHFTKAIDLDPKNSTALRGRGFALNNTSKFPESLADLDKSIELNPNPKTMDVYIVRGSIYNRMSKHDEAIVDFNKVIKLDPKNANAYIYRGSSYLSKKMFPRAIEDCTKAIEIDPKNANAFANRAAAYASSEQFAESVADCTKALELDPKNELANTIARLGAKMIDSKLKQRALENEAKRLQKLLDNAK
jgi:tetratricopeptide (TPR) repeat protein